MTLIENSTHVDDIYFHQDPPYAFSIVLALLIDIVDIDGRGLFKKMTFAFTSTEAFFVSSALIFFSL